MNGKLLVDEITKKLEATLRNMASIPLHERRAFGASRTRYVAHTLTNVPHY